MTSEHSAGFDLSEMVDALDVASTSVAGTGAAQAAPVPAGTPRVLHLVVGAVTGAAVLLFTICLISAVLPYARIRRVDPASALQSE